jgi:hypothetical protein
LFIAFIFILDLFVRFLLARNVNLVQLEPNGFLGNGGRARLMDLGPLAGEGHSGWALGQKRTLEFRAEFFNFLNRRPNFDMPKWLYILRQFP